jgi:hypothetical protein
MEPHSTMKEGDERGGGVTAVQIPAVQCHSVAFFCMHLCLLYEMLVKESHQ